MDDDLAALWTASDPVELGARLRAARRHANLTQDELGADIASTAYVSRLESGARRGDFDLFVAFAERLGMEPRELVVGRGLGPDEAPIRLQVDYAELNLVSGNAADAEAGLAGISSDTLANLSSDLRRDVRRVRAGAYEAQGRLSDAIAEGEQLVSDQHRDLDWIGDLIALSRCYRESGALQRAIAVGRQAEDEIERVGLMGTTEAIQLVLTVAAAYSDMGDMVYATQLCRDAAKRADELGSPLALASCYWNASVLEYEQGRVVEAIPLARRALIEFEKAEDSRNVGRLRGTLGVLLTRLDSPDLSEAIAVLQQSQRELRASSAGRYDLGRSSWALALALFQQGDRASAEGLLEEAAALVDDGGAPVVLASVLILRGQFAYVDGHIDVARENYLQAVRILTGMGSDRSAGELWYELAELLETVGDTEGALAAYKSAGASVGFLNRYKVGGHAELRVPTDPS